jgi:hypothetical protein
MCDHGAAFAADETSRGADFMKFTGWIAIAAVLVLAACSSDNNSRQQQAATTSTPPPEKPLAQAATGVKAKPNIATGPQRQALGASELSAALSGNSVYADASGQKFAAMHGAGGQLKGKAWSGDDGQSGAGSWKVEKDGTYCRKWDNGWAGGQWGCFKVYREGNALTMERVSGAGASGQMTLVPGNAYGL